MKKLIALFCVFAAICGHAAQIDPTFHASGQIVSLQPDGGMVMMVGIGAEITTNRSNPTLTITNFFNNVVRAFPNGITDPSFRTEPGFLYAFGLAKGAFVGRMYQDGRVRKFLPTGEQDPSFHLDFGYVEIVQLRPQEDGSFYFSGELNGGTDERRGVFHVKRDGTLDGTFFIQTDYAARQFEVLGDGRVVVAVLNGTVNGQKGSLVMCDTNGQLIPKFKYSGGAVSLLATSPGGDLYACAGTNLLKVAASGGVEWSLPLGRASSLAVLKDGHILAGIGTNIVRVAPDGAYEPDWVTGYAGQYLVPREEAALYLSSPTAFGQTLRVLSEPSRRYAPVFLQKTAQKALVLTVQGARSQLFRVQSSPDLRQWVNAGDNQVGDFVLIEPLATQFYRAYLIE